MNRCCLGAAALVLACPGTAQAAWLQGFAASHFIIYSDTSPDKLRIFATKLERFDKAMRVARSMSDPEVGDGNRLTVFVVRDVKAVQALKRGKPTTSTASTSRAPRARSRSCPSRPTRRSFDADTVFFHEYAHHLMLADLKAPMPAWLVEGFAEFMSTAKVNDDGSVALGIPANHRANNLLSDRAYQMPSPTSSPPKCPGTARSASRYTRAAGCSAIT